MAANDLLFAFVGGYSRFIINQKQFNLMNKKQTVVAASMLLFMSAYESFMQTEEAQSMSRENAIAEFIRGYDNIEMEGEV